MQPVKIQLPEQIFTRSRSVLVGDELGAFYLDKWATVDPGNIDYLNSSEILDIAPWSTRQRYTANTIYMNLVIAAYRAGMRDVVIDMSTDMQPGIDEAQRIYRENIAEMPDASQYAFHKILKNDLATPLDGVLYMSSALGMKVHAMNCGLTGIAALFRMAKGIERVSPDGTPQERYASYLNNHFAQDRRVLDMLLRRPATPSEIDAMKDCAKQLLRPDGSIMREYIFGEEMTSGLIAQTLRGKPFLGFFHSPRLLENGVNLTQCLGRLYGAENVLTATLNPDEDLKLPHKPDFIITSEKRTPIAG